MTDRQVDTSRRAETVRQRDRVGDRKTDKPTGWLACLGRQRWSDREAALVTNRQTDRLVGMSWGAEPVGQRDSVGDEQTDRQAAWLVSGGGADEWQADMCSYLAPACGETGDNSGQTGRC